MKIYFFIITSFFSTLCSSQIQQDSIQVQHQKQHDMTLDLETYFNRVVFKINSGVLLPQNQLKTYFGTIPFLELSVDFPLKNKKSIELAIQLGIPNQKGLFVINRVQDTVQAKGTFIFNPMLRFKHAIATRQYSKVSFALGIGASVIKTDARNPFYDGDREQEKFESITAFLIAPSVDYKLMLNNSSQFLISFGVQYSPYKVSGAIQENIGGLLFVPKIGYKF